VHFDMPAGDAHAPASLDEVRAAIDALDDRIIELLAERQQYVKHAAALKRGEGADAVRAPSRVEDVIAAVRSRAAAAGLAPEVAEATYRAMIDAFIELELVVHGS
jgi:isochorismate pyruvate lyase